MNTKDYWKAMQDSRSADFTRQRKGLTALAMIAMTDEGAAGDRARLDIYDRTGAVISINETEYSSHFPG